MHLKDIDKALEQVVNEMKHLAACLAGAAHRGRHGSQLTRRSRPARLTRTDGAGGGGWPAAGTRPAAPSGPSTGECRVSVTAKRSSRRAAPVAQGYDYQRGAGPRPGR